MTHYRIDFEPEPPPRGGKLGTLAYLVVVLIGCAFITYAIGELGQDEPAPAAGADAPQPDAVDAVVQAPAWQRELRKDPIDRSRGCSTGALGAVYHQQERLMRGEPAE